MPMHEGKVWKKLHVNERGLILELVNKEITLFGATYRNKERLNVLKRLRKKMYRNFNVGGYSHEDHRRYVVTLPFVDKEKIAQEQQQTGARRKASEEAYLRMKASEKYMDEHPPCAQIVHHL